MIVGGWFNLMIGRRKTRAKPLLSISYCNMTVKVFQIKIYEAM